MRRYLIYCVDTYIVNMYVLYMYVHTNEAVWGNSSLQLVSYFEQPVTLFSSFIADEDPRFETSKSLNYVAD